MTIAEIINAPVGMTKFEVNGLIASKKRIPKKSNGDYILIKIQDATGTIDVPIWDSIDACDEIVKEKSIFSIVGQRGEYDGTPQLVKSQFFEEIFPDSMKDYIPSYDIPAEALKRFIDILEKWGDQRYLAIMEEFIGLSGVFTEEFELDDINAVYGHKITNMAKWKKFITAPAAARHHGNKLGGLFLHTLGVMISIENIIENYVIYPFFSFADETKLDASRLRFCGLSHDIEKTIEYIYETNIEYNADIAVDHTILFISKMAIADEKLGGLFSQEELTQIYSIILLHHGEWGKYKAGPKDTVLLESKLLHQADMIDSQIVGAIEG